MSWAPSNSSLWDRDLDEDDEKMEFCSNPERVRSVSLDSSSVRVNIEVTPSHQSDGVAENDYDRT